jgi:hypothetical protein
MTALNCYNIYYCSKKSNKGMGNSGTKVVLAASILRGRIAAVQENAREDLYIITSPLLLKIATASESDTV